MLSAIDNLLAFVHVIACEKSITGINSLRPSDAYMRQ